MPTFDNTIKLDVEDLGNISDFLVKINAAFTGSPVGIDLPVTVYLDGEPVGRLDWGDGGSTSLITFTPGVSA